jgi:Zn-dependent M28 family amino/carboxypeptidase
VAFILFDNEEKGLKGSKGYHNEHKEAMKNRLLINFDCVGNGEHILFIVPKALQGGEEMEGLRRAMQAEGGYTPYFFPAKGSTCNSDQKSFPHGVACVACRRTRRGIFYTPAIHTEKDTVAKDANVRYLADGVGLWLRGQNKK